MFKIFISYNHNDESVVNEFLKFTAPIRHGENALFEVWYDREMEVGVFFEEVIRTKLNESDGAILFISADYLNSPSCIEEKKLCTQLLSRKSGFRIFTIIVRKCLWREDNKLKSILSLTTDAKPLSCFESREDAWMDIAKNLKKILSNNSIQLSEKTQNITHQTSDNISMDNTATLTFDIRDKDKFQLFLSILQQFNIALVTVEINHFDGNPNTANQAYQISETPLRIAALLCRIYDEVDTNFLTDIHYIYEANNFERDELTLFQTIQLINNTTNYGI